MIEVRPGDSGSRHPVGHLGPAIIPPDDSVHVCDDAGAHLESAEFPVPAPGEVVPAGFNGDQCC